MGFQAAIHQASHLRTPVTRATGPESPTVVTRFYQTLEDTIELK